MCKHLSLHSLDHDGRWRCDSCRATLRMFKHGIAIIWLEEE